MERGGEGYFKGGTSLLLSFGSRSSYETQGGTGPLDAEELSLITASRSGDDAFDGDEPNPASSSNNVDPRSHSLLTAFLLQLDSLLPEYCEHLSTASDTLDCIGGASKAVGVLERGAKTLSETFGAAAANAGSAASPQQSSSRASSAPSSPSSYQRSLSPVKRSHQGTSPTKKSSIVASPPWRGSPSKLAPGLSWLYPLSPRSRGESSQGSSAHNNNKKRISPKKRTKSKKSGAEWNAIAESEWEKFVAPFLNLAGAECFYAKMEHVLDPRKSLSGGADDFQRQPGGGAVDDEVDCDREGGTKSSFVQGGDEDDKGLSHHPLTSPTDANKRGSRRLISMYRQVREDLVVVGEYLCDPVLGARAGTGDKRSQRLPPPPLNFESSPEKKRHIGRAKSGGNEARAPNDDCDGRRTTAHEKREFAAISLRNTLDALISFIDARCVLIRIHAELCCQSSQPFLLPPVEASDGGGARVSQKNGRFSDKGHGGGKWVALSDQCRSVMKPVSAWAGEGGCTAKRAAADVERELKALDLLLISINHLFECNLFNCVVNVRRLHVLLGKTTHKRLPIMYIRSSLRELLAMMHIYFADASAGLEMLRHGQFPSLQSPSTPRSGGLSSSRRSFNKSEDDATKSASGKSKSSDLNSLFAEFVGRFATANSLPLALAVVHRTGGSQDSTLDEHQEGEGDEDSNECPESVSSWEPRYMKSTVENDSSGTVATGKSLNGTYDSFFKRRDQGHNLVRTIKENFSTDQGMVAKTSEPNVVGNANRAMRTGGATSWPFDHWADIERVLSKHCMATETTELVKHDTALSDTRASISNNDINGKIQRRTSITNQSKVISHCYISSISEKICLVVIQGVGHAKRHRASDDDIEQFMQKILPKLSPENLLSIKIVMGLKFELFEGQEKQQQSEQSNISASSPNDNGTNVPNTTSLWSETGWSDDQRKKILQSLGLRRKHSPVMAPLKSPYVKRQIRGRLGGRQRKKRLKNSINHGHLDFFLGPELSHLL